MGAKDGPRWSFGTRDVRGQHDARALSRENQAAARRRKAERQREAEEWIAKVRQRKGAAVAAGSSSPGNSLACPADASMTAQAPVTGDESTDN